MNVNGFEIERKFLIAMPAESLLAAAERSDIVQTYLLGDEGTTERVRARTYEDHTEYTHTTKVRISAVRRVELEETIGPEAYAEIWQIAWATTDAHANTEKIKAEKKATAEMEEKIIALKSKNEKLKQDLDKLKIIHDKLKAYEDFLKKVKDKHPESFSDLNGVIEKYRVLEDKYNEIKKETDSAKIQKEKEKVKFREEKSKLESQINGLITNIQSVQGQLKELKEKKKNLENEVTMMEANSNTVVSSLEMILLAVDNIYEKCSKKNNWTQHGDAKEFSKFDVDIKDKKKAYHQRVQEAKTKIKYINNYIQDYVKITEDYKKAKKLQQQQNQGK